MTTTLTDSIMPPQAVAANPIVETSPTSAHRTLVSLGVILIVTILLVELAGVNKDWAAFAGLLFLGVLLIQGITHPQSLQGLEQYPAVP
jgi:hypothetical protein